MFVQKKLDLNRFYRFVVSRGYKKTFKEMRENLLDAAPLLGIVDDLKLDKNEKQNLKFAEKVSFSEDIQFYMDAEIQKSLATPDDFNLRSADGGTEPAYYRFERRLNKHERNLLKLAYSVSYGDPEKTPFWNYMDSRPILKKNLDKDGKSDRYTRNPDDFQRKTYN